jgi:GDP-4-dehydro-6-deoxy-D-mannose reductase
VRVFVTGVTGFVGRWLAAELREVGHEVIHGGGADGTVRLDVTDDQAVIEAVSTARPDALIHLAAVSSATEAAGDRQTAFEVAVAGTVNVMEAVRALEDEPAVLVVSSSEVYGSPATEDLPLTEAAPLRPRTPYAIAKVAQESVALAYAARLDLRVAVARSFNHIGPGQRPVFVVPALAQRILALKSGEADDIPVGNLDVRRDFTDVRDVARAYRLLVDRLADGSIDRGGAVFNVASGRAASIRHIVDVLAGAAAVEVRTRVDPTLVRMDDPEEIRGDAHRLRRTTGWQPTYSLDETLHAVWHDVAGDPVALAQPTNEAVGR